MKENNSIFSHTQGTLFFTNVQYIGVLTRSDLLYPSNGSNRRESNDRRNAFE